MKKSFFYLLLTILSCVFIHAVAIAESVPELEKMYLSQDYKTRIDALKIIERSAINNPVLFEQIAERILLEYALKPGDSEHADDMAWHCKALASSGDAKYLQTLDTVINNATNDKLVRHCKRSKDQFDIYVDNRRILSQPTIEGYSEEMSGNIHMLRSGNFRMMRYAVNNIAASPEADETVYDMVRDILKENTKELYTSKEFHQLDTLCYFCKCLGASGVPKYIDDLKEVRQITRSKKLNKHALLAIKSLQ